MDALNVIVFLYLHGAVGFLIGMMLSERTFKLENVEYLILSTVLWPRAIWSLYVNEIDKQARGRICELQKALDDERYSTQRLINTLAQQHSDLLRKHQSLQLKYKNLEKQIASEKPDNVINYPKSRKDNEPLR